MNAAVPGKIMVSPCAGVELPRAAKARPLAWTAQREAAFWAALDKRMRELAERDLTTAVQKQAIWAAKNLRPCPVMVWLPVHTRAASSMPSHRERLFALFCLAAYCGLRRDEIIGLTWPEVDLDDGDRLRPRDRRRRRTEERGGRPRRPAPGPGGPGAQGLAGTAGL